MSGARTDDRREAAYALLAERFGDRFSRAEAVRNQHVNTVTWVPPQPPEAVLEAESTAEVSEIVKICSSHALPLIPFGTGTSVDGHINAPFGGLCLSLRRMNKILEVNPGDFDATVQAGVTREQLNAHLRDHGLFFPIDPGADASIGGMAATRASGTNAVRYGTMRETVVALTVVLPDGSISRTASRARKSAAAYDMTRLFVGSEGTLGVITEVTVRLSGIPDSIRAGYGAFPDVESACNAVIETLQAGLPIARVELLDAAQVVASNAYSKLDLEPKPHLFVEFHGSETATTEQVELFEAIAAANSGSSLTFATRPEERSRLWKARHEAFWAAVATRPGSRGVSTDICVPISRLAECVMETRADMEAHGIPGTMLGHVGDGNFHAIPLVDPSNPDEVKRMDAFLDRLADRAHRVGGTCTGEHGVGQGRRHHLEAEYGPDLVKAMKAIKAALDPIGFMNPGKTLPD